ncbi:MAG: RDD family protein [Methanobacteriota archaeon]
MADTISSSIRWGSFGSESERRDYAGFWRRLAAALIDLIILIFIAGTVSAYLGFGEGWRMFLMILRRQEVIADDGTVITSLIPMPVGTFILVVFILIPWIYFAVLESSRNQATLGKMACRVQVSDLHGNPITFARATLRHFSKFISFLLFFAGFLCITYTRYSQGFHDVIAASLVWYKREVIELN